MTKHTHLHISIDPYMNASNKNGTLDTFSKYDIKLFEVDKWF